MIEARVLRMPRPNQPNTPVTHQPTSPDDGAKPKQPSMAKMFGVVATLTVLSKIVGLARDIVVAMAYGTSVVADAYNYAYLFTGNILILFGGLGGPFHSSTVAIVTPRKDDRNTGLLICQIMALTIAVLLLITLVFFVLAGPLAQLVQQQYNPQPTLPKLAGEKPAVLAMDLMPTFVKKQLFETQFQQQLIIMLPLIVIAGIVGVSYGVLNVYHKVFWPSLSPTIASIAIIVAIYVMRPSDAGQQLLFGLPLAIGTLAGAVGQMVAQFPGMLRLPLNWRLDLKPQAGLAEYTGMLWPAIFSTSVGQLTVYVDSFFTLLIPTQGAWTAVVYSNRLVQLPLGILLTAMLVPILPRFTELAMAKEPEALKSELRRGMSFLWFLCLPIAATLFVIAHPIIEVLFQGGHFDAQSTQMVTVALVYLVPSIVFYVARDLMTRVYYAYQDSTTPYKVALAAIIVKAPLDWMLVTATKSVAGISLASTIITIFNLTLLTWGLKIKIGDLGLTRLIKPLSVMLFGAGLCGLLTLFTYESMQSAMHLEHRIAKLVIIAIGCSAGSLAYIAVCAAFRLEEPTMLLKRLPIVRDYFEKRVS